MELMVRIAKALDVSVEFLMRADKEAAVGKIRNQELLHQLRRYREPAGRRSGDSGFLPGRVHKTQKI
jgi:plasmid maintenance system antidote protein VapI